MAEFGPWQLSAAEESRLRNYERLKDLVCRNAAQYDPLYQRDKQEAVKSIPQLWVDFPALVCRVAADLILPKEPIFSAPDEAVTARLSALMQRSNIRKLAWRAVFWTAAQGDAFLVVADVAMSKGGRPMPVLSLRRASGSVARNVRGEDSPLDRKFLFKSELDGVELYTEYLAGETRWHAYKGGQKVALPAGYTTPVETKDDIPLCVHLAALRGNDGDENFGESDFAGTEDMCFEVSNRLRQVGKILDRHSEPAMNVPDGSVDENAALNVRKKKVFERGVDGTGMEYVTWQSQLAEAYTEIDKLADLILLLTETPPALWGRDKNGQAESGRALKFRLLSGLGKARRTGGMLSEGLVAAARIALRREDILSGKAPGDYTDIECELSNTFIADELETADETAKLRSAGVMSVRQGVARTGLTGVKLDAELQAIADEAPPAAPLGVGNGL
jgi:hypothetical protein